MPIKVLLVVVFIASILAVTVLQKQSASKGEGNLRASKNTSNTGLDVDSRSEEVRALDTRLLVFTEQLSQIQEVVESTRSRQDQLSRQTAQLDQKINLLQSHSDPPQSLTTVEQLAHIEKTVIEPEPPAILEQIVVYPGVATSSTPGTDTLNVPPETVFFDVAPLTYLVGRVPKQGAVQDALPFKAVVRSSQVMAGPFRKMPYLKGLVLSGTVTGDVLLSCIRGAITRMTLVYSSGEYVTTSVAEATDTIGYITDKKGNTCIPGKLISTLALGTVISAGASAIEGYGRAYAQSQTLNTSSGQTITNIEQYAQGLAIADATQSIDSWIGEKLSDTWDAVVVPPTIELMVHTTQPLQLQPL